MTASVSSTAAPSHKVPWWLVLIEGIALVIIGALFLVNPAQTAKIVVQILGIWWLISGIVRIVSMFMDHTAWGWKLFSGLLGIVAGLIVLNHPLWSPIVLGTTLVIVLGIMAILQGIMGIIVGVSGGGWGALILGVIGIIIGIILLANVWVATFSLPWVLGIFAVIGGIIAIIGAFAGRR